MTDTPDELIETIFADEEDIPDLDDDASPAARLLHKTRLVERDVKNIPRSGDHGEYDYKFLEDKVLTPIVAHAQRKHGIKTVFRMEDWEVLRPHPEATPKRMVMWTVEVFLIDDPETKLTIPWVSEAFSQGDKGTSKAVSQGRKDFYRTFYDIGGGPENENPDAETDGAGRARRAPRSKATSDEEEEADWSGATEKQVNYLEYLQRKCKGSGLDHRVGDLESVDEASEAIDALEAILDDAEVDY